jgi:hypothetical protein
MDAGERMMLPDVVGSPIDEFTAEAFTKAPRTTL